MAEATEPRGAAQTDRKNQCSQPSQSANPEVPVHVQPRARQAICPNPCRCHNSFARACGARETARLGRNIHKTRPKLCRHFGRFAVLFTFLQPFAQISQICAWRVHSQLLG